MPTNILTAKWTRPKALEVRAIISRLGLCPCGGDAHWRCVLELLSEAEVHTDKGFYRNEWFEFGAKVLDSWGLLEHGTGIGWAWLTEDGELLLEFLRDFGIEDHRFADGSGHPRWAAEFSWGEADDEWDTYGEWAQGRVNSCLES